MSINDIILKALKKSNCNKKFENTNIPMQHETLLLRKYLFEKFSENDKFKLVSNLSKNQLYYMNKYEQNLSCSVIVIKMWDGFY